MELLQQQQLLQARSGNTHIILKPTRQRENGNKQGFYGTVHAHNEKSDDFVREMFLQVL